MITIKLWIYEEIYDHVDEILSLGMKFFGLRGNSIRSSRKTWIPRFTNQNFWFQASYAFPNE